MKLIRILNRSIRDSFKSVFRNFSLSIASVSCTVITLLLVAASIIVSYNVNNMTTNIEESLTMVVFVDSSTEESKIKEIEKDIKDINNIESITYRSKIEIKEAMSKENDTFKTIMDSWEEEENPLQSTFIIKVKNIKKIKETATTIKNIDNVTLVKYGESMVNKMISVFDVIKKVCVILVVTLILVTAFLISNTIKITIFSRKNEISIMRLVGTSNTVIKLPFLFEGFLLGVLGSIIPICITIFGYGYFYESMGGVVLSNLVELSTPSSIVYYTSLLILIVGAGVGMIGSVKAVRKYLKI